MGKNKVRSITVTTTSNRDSETAETNLAGEGSHVNTAAFNDTFEDTFSEGNDAETHQLSKHHQRRAKEFSNWEAIRESLLKARVEEEVISSFTCFTCANPLIQQCLVALMCVIASSVSLPES